MTTPGNIGELQAAVSYHRAGRWAEAEALYRQVVAAQPGNAEAWRLFGILARDTGNPALAVQMLQRSLALAPEALQPHLDLGEILQAGGDLPGAIRAFGIACHVEPDTFEGHIQLGHALHAAGRHEVAVEAFREAIRVKPDAAEAHNNVGVVLQILERRAEALEEYEVATRLAPRYLAAWNNTGSVLQLLGRFDESVAAFRCALEIDPRFADSWYGLASVLQASGRPADAVAAHRQALQIFPGYADAWNNLGAALQILGQREDALEACREALRLRPGFADAHNNLGNILEDCRQYGEAIAAYRQALALDPRHADASNNLATVYHALGDLDVAQETCRRALQLRPNHAAALTNLGNILQDSGRADLAIECHRRALELNPQLAAAGSNLLLCLCYDPASTAAGILEESREWDRRLGASQSFSIRAQPGRDDVEKKLRVGFVSADFCEHVAGYSFLPFFQHHDRSRFEILGYSNVQCSDAMTERFRGHASLWRNLAGFSDGDAAALIASDAVDILVDLAGHTNRNCLPIFARKPAAVQATYLGYCGTTGLSAMDYRVSDPYFDPPGSDLSCYSEETVRLSRSYWCYEPMRPVPEGTPALPSRVNGYVTYGCLNKFAKVSGAAQDLWVRILQATPQSRLILNAPIGRSREAVRRRFAAGGIDAERLEFAAKQSWDDYLRTWQRCDVALDPFPFGGGITSCDALWMGVPVVTLAGATSVGRGGSSILHNIGLPELVAETPEQYVEIAVRRAGDPVALEELRGGLRGRMERSPLRDGPGFARDFEEALRTMWRKFCRVDG